MPSAGRPSAALRAAWPWAAPSSASSSVSLLFWPSSASNDLAHRLGEALGRAHQDVHADLAALAGGRLVVLGACVVAQCTEPDHPHAGVAHRPDLIDEVLLVAALEKVRDQHDDRARGLADQVVRVEQSLRD